MKVGAPSHNIAARPLAPPSETPHAEAKSARHRPRGPPRGPRPDGGVAAGDLGAAAGRPADGCCRGLFPLPLHPLDEYLLLLFFILPIWGLLLSAAGFYRSHRTLPLGEEIWAAGKVAFGGTAILVLLIFGLRLDFVSRWFLVALRRR